MPGDDWQKFANLRLLYAYMWAQPGKKLLFMGGEFGQWTEWNHDAALDWALLDFEPHAKMRMLLGTLNHLYKSEPALHDAEVQSGGFEWIDCHDAENNVLSFLRKAAVGPGHCSRAVQLHTGAAGELPCWRAFQRTLARVSEHRRSGVWRLGNGNFGGATTVPIPLHGRLHSLTITLPPSARSCLRWDGPA